MEPTRDNAVVGIGSEDPTGVDMLLETKGHSGEEPTEVEQHTVEERPHSAAGAETWRCNEDLIRELIDILDDDV